MFNGTNLDLSSDVYEDILMFYSHDRSLTFPWIIRQSIQIKIYKRGKTKLRT